MTRLLVMPVLLITAAFALLLAGVHLQPRTDPVLAYLGGCAASCWRGIEPGVTDPQSALHQLATAYSAPPSQAECLAPPSLFCVRFTWHPENALPAIELVIDHNVIQAVIVYPPGFTLGEALLSQSHVRGGLLGATAPSSANGRFYFQLVFDHARLLLALAPDCVGGISSLLHTPVRNLSINLPLGGIDQQYLASFTDVQRRWHQLCER